MLQSARICRCLLTPRSGLIILAIYNFTSAALFCFVKKSISFILFDEFLREIEIDNLTVSNSELIPSNFTV